MIDTWWETVGKDGVVLKQEVIKLCVCPAEAPDPHRGAMFKGSCRDLLNGRRCVAMSFLSRHAYQ